MISGFHEVAETESKIASRKMLYGVGVIDANYKLYVVEGGKFYFCPFYKVWKSMMTRCYSEKYHTSNRPYEKCTVAVEWHSFNAFRSWMETHEWKNMYLDKDIIIMGNKNYSPENCIFVSRHLNNLVQERRKNKTGLPVGVGRVRSTERYYARHVLYGKKTHLGVFNSPEDAEAAYINAKISDFVCVAEEQSDERIKTAILSRANSLREGINHG